MNGGTARGGAYGFKLDALAKLHTIRGVDPKVTLVSNKQMKLFIYKYHKYHKSSFFIIKYTFLYIYILDELFSSSFRRT